MAEADQATGAAAGAAGAADAGDGIEIPEVIPVLSTGAGVLYPAIVVPYVSVDAADIAAVDDATKLPSRIVGVVARQPSASGEHDGPLQPVGTAAAIVRMARGAQGGVQAILQGVARVRLVEVVQETPYPRARVERLADRLEPSAELEALTRSVISLFQRLVALTETLPNELGLAVGNITYPGNLADFIAANVALKPEERQAVLEAVNVTERLRLVNGFLARELEVAEVEQTIRSQVQTDLDKRQREYILREQLAAIQKELGEEEVPELAELRQKLEAAGLPAEARREADRELKRLETIPAVSPEYQVTRTYLEWLADLPWDTSSDEHLDIAEAARILDADHYGLEKVKQRILDYLAVRKLLTEPDRGPGDAGRTPAGAGDEDRSSGSDRPPSPRPVHSPILCFVGPPGVGKTSLGQSIARATGRKFVRMSLGGVRDEAEIRGHRRTYVGAMPGRVIQELRRAGTNNPLIMLDEVDKLGTDYRGDPASALLEVLDPAQNNTFQDHYLDVPFDLSKVLFITTANLLDPVPGPLRDRMEIIEIPGYTEREKLEIARRYLVPRQIRENGLEPEDIELPDETLLALIHGYTREAGVRNLERVIGAVCRRIARRVVEAQPNADGGARSAERDDAGTRPEAETAAPFRVTPEELPDLLSEQPLPTEVLGEQDEVGVATGMAATAVGGEILFIEAAAVPGKGGFTLTGKLGDVMQESARAALTYTRARAGDFGIKPAFFETHDLHVHVPAGAIPKDGPSAGVTMATALVSAVSRRPVRRDVAMTGEISLRGKVLPVGGIKEKVLAAHRAGIRQIVLPKENARDLDDIPPDLRDDIRFVFAEHVDDVLNAALHARRRPPRDRLRPELRAAPEPRHAGEDVAAAEQSQPPR